MENFSTIHQTAWRPAQKNSWGEVDANPHEFFWAGRHTIWRIALKFSIAYGASFAQLLAKKIGRVRSGHEVMTS